MANGYTNEAKAEEAGNLLAKRLFDARGKGTRVVSQYELCEAGDWYETIEADDAASALEVALGNVDPDNYPDAEGTLYIDVRARNVDDRHDDASDTVTLDPTEPECSEDEHRWESPYKVVGGCKENPGVWAHGGGVRIHEVCAHCGVHRHTDTWATRRDTGEQGLTEVRYEAASEEAAS